MVFKILKKLKRTKTIGTGKKPKRLKYEEIVGKKETNNHVFFKTKGGKI